MFLLKNTSMVYQATEVFLLGDYIFIFGRCVCLLIYKSYEYIEKMSIDEVNQEIINSSFALPDNVSEDELTNDGVILDQKLNDKQVKDKYTFDKVFSKLKKINNETVGYLVVNGTNISYPLVQHSDNVLLSETIACCHTGSQLLLIMLLKVFEPNKLLHDSACILIL